jgi:hypothetical protein
MPWSARFDDPIPLPNGRAMETLADARAYVLKLKKADQDSAPWQTAIVALLMAAEGRGPVMHARIGMLQALNAGKPKPDPAARRKRAKAYRIVRSEDGWGKGNVLRRTYSDPERLTRGAVFDRSETIRGKGNEAHSNRIGDCSGAYLSLSETKSGRIGDASHRAQQIPSGRCCRRSVASATFAAEY